MDGTVTAAEDARSEGVAESVREGLEDLVEDDTVEGLEAGGIGRVDGVAWMLDLRARKEAHRREPSWRCGGQGEGPESEG